MSEIIKKRSRSGLIVLFAVAALFLSIIPKGSAAFSTVADDDNRAEVTGPITVLPNTQGWIGEWTVVRTKVKVTATTKIDQTRGKVVLGALVEVKGTKQSDGVIAATDIVVKLSPPTSFPFSITGKVDELPSTPSRVGDWKVAGRTIHVSTATKIDQSKGQVAVGVLVEVDGLLQTDGSINASEIEVKQENSGGIQVKFLGKIEKLPANNARVGDWVISGRTVSVTDRTVIKTEQGQVMIGALVDVEGVAQVNGSIVASKLEIRGSVDPPVINVYFRGTIETLPAASGNPPAFIGNWKVSGRTVKVAATTAVNEERGKVAVGAGVEVSGTLAGDGTVTAQKIAVISNAPTGAIRFTGLIVSLPPSNGTVPGFIGDWKIGDRIVHVVVATKVDQEKARVAVGARVEVVGTERADKSVDASSIEVKEAAGGGQTTYVRFFGTLTKLPDASIQIGNGLAGDWTVGGKTVHVVPQTRINRERGNVAVGAFLEVEGNQRTDGSVDAVSIEVERDANAPSGAVGYINFYGPIRTLPSAANLVGTWFVDGKMVQVSTNTKLEQQRIKFAVGVNVSVAGYLLNNASIAATRIESRPGSGGPFGYVEFIGNVTKLPDTANNIGDWTVAGRTVHVSRRTQVKREIATIAVGATVEVNGVELPDGTVDATQIEVEHGPSGASFVTFSALASVNAGSYLSGNTSSAIVASFGEKLANGVDIAKTLPLPTELGGVSVLVDGNPAGLFFVSPGQINYQVPDDLLPGTAQVAVMKNGQVVAQGALELGTVAPSLFTADASGNGIPAGVLLRVRANGQQSYEPLARYVDGRVEALPITRNAGDRLFLVLYGTGWRGADDTDGNAANGVAESLEITIGDKVVRPDYAGLAPGFAGMDQINVELPADVTGTVGLLVKVNDGDGKLVRTNSVTLSIR
ncbi:MAG TPA: DUF5666 domain-containing protein [Blastocatellia bacterium]|nr:DUF5666 domain-containing protein [Blastocatellia bacterium]